MPSRGVTRNGLGSFISVRCLTALPPCAYSAIEFPTDGDGPGLATGLYWFGDMCRRLSFREAARTHSIPETTIDTIESFVTTTISDKSRQQKELFRLIGNSIPAMTLHDVVRHLLSLLNW